MSSNRRQEERNPCFLRADLILDAHIPPITAQAHDISDRGLKLIVEDARTIPDRFIVSIPRRHLREVVRVMRRSPTELGVRIERSARA